MTSTHNELLYTKIVQEIINTEKSYLNQLEMLSKFFSDVILQRKFMPKDVHSSLFGQLSTLYQINCKLFEELSSGHGSIGQSFLKLGPFLKVYSSYANSFQRSLSLLQEWLTKSNEFKEFVNATETRPEVQCKLTALMITPIQRIPRYKLLLEELLKVTDSSLQKYIDIEGALMKVSEAANHINQSVDDAEALQKLLTLQKALRNQQPNIIIPGRKLIKDGILNKVSRKGKGSQARLFFLFTDIIMYTKIPLQPLNSSSKLNLNAVHELDLKPNSLECCCILPLRYCRVTVVLGSLQHGITFRLQCSDEDLLLYSDSSSEGKKWVSAIEDTAAQALQKRKTLRKVSSNKKAIRRPALRKQCNSDDENNPSPKIPTNPKDRRLMSSPLTRSLLLVKECLTPPKLWLTPRKKRPKPPPPEKQVPAPSPQLESPLGPRFVSRRMSSKNSPRITSPLAVRASPNDANLDDPLDYTNKPSLTLRSRFKDQHARLLSPPEQRPTKRPARDFISPNIFRYKRRKKDPSK